MELKRAEQAIAGIPAGGSMVTGSGLLRITWIVGEDGTTPAIRWRAGRVTSVPDLDEEEAAKRLSHYKDSVLDGSAVFDAGGAQVGASRADGEWGVYVLDYEAHDPLGPPQVAISGHIEGARNLARDLYEERSGSCSVEIRDLTTGKTKETIRKKVHEMAETTSKNGSAKKEASPLPRGFKVGVGADLAPGDQVVTDADRGPERVVSIGSGGVSRGRAYLKLMLEAPAGGDGEPRRRFISPRKEYPMKKATKAEAEKAAKRLAAEKKTAEKTEKKEAPKKGAEKKGRPSRREVVENRQKETAQKEAVATEPAPEKVEAL